MYDAMYSLAEKATASTARSTAALLSIVALLVPSWVAVISDMGWNLTIFGSVLWLMTISPSSRTRLIIGPHLPILTLPLNCLQFAFVYWVYKYCMGRTTKIRVIQVGILAEIQSVLSVNFVTTPLVIWFQIPFSTPFYTILPIPILLLIGVFIVRTTPALQDYIHWEYLEEYPVWWEEIEWDDKS